MGVDQVSSAGTARFDLQKALFINTETPDVIHIRFKRIGVFPVRRTWLKGIFHCILHNICTRNCTGYS